MQKGGEGFPYLAALDSDGNVLAKLGMVPRTVESFKALMKEATGTQQELADLAKKAEAGDLEATGKLLERELGLGYLKLEDAQKRLAKLDKLPDEQKERILDAMLGLEVREAMTGVTQERATQVEAGKKLAKLVMSGREPKDRMARLNAWYFASIYAEETKNVEILEKVLTVFSAEKGIREEFLTMLKDKIAEIKKGGGK
jgi:hypothetical protein